MFLEKQKAALAPLPSPKPTAWSCWWGPLPILYPYEFVPSKSVSKLQAAFRQCHKEPICMWKLRQLLNSFLCITSKMS